MNPEAYSRALDEAETHARLGLPIPKAMRHRLVKRVITKLSWFFLHHQVAFNAEVLAALKATVLSQARQGAQLEALGDLRAAVTTHTSQLEALSADLWAAITAHSGQLEALGDIWVAITTHRTSQLEALDDLRAAITAHTSQLETLSADLWAAITAHTSQLEGLGELWAAIADARELLEQQQVALKLQVDLVQRQAFARHHEGIADLRTELAEMGLLMGEFHKKLDTGAAELRLRQGAVDLLLNEVRRSLPEPLSPQALEKLPRAMDAMYAEFEEVFRGPSVHVTEVVKEYLPDVLALDRHGPIVDLGSGRGEWLELLKDAGVDAYGVDLNQEFVEQCQARGLKVLLADACEHLAGVSERSLSAVTAFHLVENVSIDRVIELIDLSVRALQPGGLLILETPNPENLVVGASSFYVDPSHVRPLPPDLLAFLVEARGLADVETRFLHPNAASNLRSPRDTEPWSGDLAPLVEAVNARLYGPQDYAVIGRRL
jgi:SAM-dependent methyltransferase